MLAQFLFLSTDGDDDSHGDPTEQPTEESSESDFPVSEMSEGIHCFSQFC